MSPLFLTRWCKSGVALENDFAGGGIGIFVDNSVGGVLGEGKCDGGVTFEDINGNGDGGICIWKMGCVSIMKGETKQCHIGRARSMVQDGNHTTK